MYDFLTRTFFMIIYIFYFVHEDYRSCNNFKIRKIRVDLENDKIILLTKYNKTYNFKWKYTLFSIFRYM